MPASTPLAASLLSAVMSAAGVADCAKESGETATAYVTHGFAVRELKLYDGTRVAVAVSHDPCLAHNAVNRVLVYARMPGGGYRIALDDYGFPDNVQASSDGTVTLASHETVEIVDEATYVWNGTRYVFSPERSHRNDVAVGQDRPYAERVAFARGTSFAVLAGSIAGGFGDDYEFEANAGQRVTIQMRGGFSKNLRFDVYRDRAGDRSPQELTTLNSPRTWSAVLPASGTWKLDVYGVDTMDRETTEPYSLVLTIRG
jgi:hypothetical protein